MSLIDHPEGNYRFLPGIAPYSCGAVSAPGFEIVHAVLQRPLPYRAGFDRIAGHLAAAGRPKAALCGVELRSPAPFSFPGFAAFNGEYAAILEGWGLLVNVWDRRRIPVHPSVRSVAVVDCRRSL